MRSYTWLKLNDTLVALNESGKLVGYIAHLHPLTRGKSKARDLRALQGA